MFTNKTQELIEKLPEKSQQRLYGAILTMIEITGVPLKDLEYLIAAYLQKNIDLITKNL